jgi:hypothetical protein
MESVHQPTAPQSVLPTVNAFDLVFGFSCRDRLPLHVGRGVGSAARERHDVIDDVATGRCGQLSG